MKHIGILMSLLLVGVATLARPVTAASELETIQAHYTQINRNLRTYNRVQRDLSGFSTEGGSLDIYAAASVPRKIVATYYGETGRASEEYYFWNNSLFFVLRTETRDDDVFGPVKTKSEQRFYFSNGKLIRWLDDRKLKEVDTEEARMREQEVLTTTREFLDKAKAALKK